MEQEIELRQLVRKTLNEIAKPIKSDEPVKTPDDLVKNKDTEGNTLSEKSVLDDKNLQGADKVFARVHDKLK